jgi:hypothetical protein
MPKEWAAYTRANEFEASQKQALHELALQRMNQEAAKNFDAATIYQASNRSAYLSEYKRVPDGFEAALPSGVTLHTTYFSHADGHREVIDIPSLYGLKDVLDHEMPGVVQGASPLPFIALRYAWLPSDADALRTGTDGRNTVFIAMEATRARKIAEEYRDVGARRAVADIFVRIEKCQHEQPGTYALTARGLRAVHGAFEQRILRDRGKPEAQVAGDGMALAGTMNR